VKARSLQIAVRRGAVLAIASAAWLSSLEAQRLARFDYVLWALTGAIGLALTATVVRSRGWLSPTSAYLSVFWLFHFGFTFTVSLMSARAVAELPYWAQDMILDPDTTRSAFLATLFMACVWLGADLSGSRAMAKVDPDNERWSAPELLRIGWLVMAFGAGLSVFAISQVGVGTFFGSYDVFFEQNDLVTWAILVLANGLFLLLDGGLPLKTIMMTALITYVPMAALCLIGGSRTGPMFTAVGLAVALHHRGIRFSKTALLLAVVGGLLTIGVLRQVREQGVTLALSSRSQQVEENPVVSAIIEMGASLSTVSASLQWLEGREFFHGATYALPFIRGAQRLAGIERLSLEDDPRFVKEQIYQVYGPIGYSVVAEAYVNFAETGVALFGLACGVVLGVLGRRARRQPGLAVMGAVLVPMLINIRNSFLSVPVWICIGLAPILLAGLLRLWRSPRIHAPAPA